MSSLFIVQFFFPLIFYLVFSPYYIWLCSPPPVESRTTSGKAPLQNGSINYTARTTVRLYVSLGNRAEWRATNLFLSANKKPNYYYNESGERIRYQIEFEQNMETKLTVAFLSWRRLHAVRMHTRRSLDRHDYTHSIDLSALHIRITLVKQV